MDGEEGWDRRGLNKEASGVGGRGGPANHLLPSLGHSVRMVQRLLWPCPTFARCPSLLGLAEKEDHTPLPPDHTGEDPMAGTAFCF